MRSSRPPSNPPQPYGPLQRGPKLYRGEPTSVAEQVLRDALAGLRSRLLSDLAQAEGADLVLYKAKAQVIQELENDVHGIIQSHKQERTPLQ